MAESIRYGLKAEGKEFGIEERTFTGSSWEHNIDGDGRVELGHQEAGLRALLDALSSMGRRDGMR